MKMQRLPHEGSICNATARLQGGGSPPRQRAAPGAVGQSLRAAQEPRCTSPLRAPPVPALVLGSPEAAVFLWRQTAWEGQQDKRLCGKEWVTSQVCGKPGGGAAL